MNKLATALGAMGIVLAAGMLSACGRAADLSCDEIARQSQQLSQSQDVKFKAITGVRETNKTDTERRCEGTAELDSGETGTVYMRGFEQDGNQLVEYRPEPF